MTAPGLRLIHVRNYSPVVFTNLIFRHLSVSILDLSGFENFKISGNGFEQLCINVANEQLHYFFWRQAVENEQNQYTQEGIKWQQIQFGYNEDLLKIILTVRYLLFNH